MDTGKRRYIVYSIVYLTPYLRFNSISHSFDFELLKTDVLLVALIQFKSLFKYLESKYEGLVHSEVTLSLNFE